MCGRYTYFSSEDVLKEFDLEKSNDLQLALDIPDNYNVSPGAHMPVIVRGTQGHKVEFMIWGLVPSWSKTSETTLKLINARRESLLEKPMWKRLVKSKRCIVPARGFYEWKAEHGQKNPYYITPVVDKVFSFAGLWDEWHDEHGSELTTFTIITTNPNKKMATIHSRMPAILTKDKMDRWLEPVDLSQTELDDLLKPVSYEHIHIERVSTKVNNVRNNSEDLIYPLE
mgnify:CR=1 FL=1